MGLLREWFGPSKEEIWRQLCTEIGATYLDGGFWKGAKVQAQHREWIVTIDTYTHRHGETSTSYTRLRAPYVNRDGFRFTISRAGFFSELGKIFGIQDVEIRHPEFDEAFVIKGTDERQLRALFANETIRQLLEFQPSVRFTVKDDEGWFSKTFPEGVDELEFTTLGVVKDIDRLKALFYLFAETLDHLCQIGSAYEDHPGVEL